MPNQFKAGYERMLGFLGLADPQPETEPAAGSDDEHRAVLELLVATMFADRTVTERELAAIDRFGDEQGWNTPAFSFTQAMGSATAKVRDALGVDGGLDELLASAAARITTPEVRNEVVHACRAVAAADGTTDEPESAWLASVAEAMRR